MQKRLEAKPAATFVDNDNEVETLKTNGAKKRLLPFFDMTGDEVEEFGSKRVKTERAVFFPPSATSGSSTSGTATVNSFQTSYSVIFDDTGKVW